MEKQDRLSTEDLDALLDPVVTTLLNKVIKKGIAVDEQHKRLEDIVELFKTPSFTKKKSLLDLKRLRIWANNATKSIDRIAKQLAKKSSDDAAEQGMALSDYRQQLRAAFISRLILIKAEDSCKNWDVAMKAAATVAGVATVTGLFYLAGKIVQRRRRNQEAEKVRLTEPEVAKGRNPTIDAKTPSA
ncbi:TPA: hypothetical protein DD449_02955 [Candidatus Berkelbacteria bacterium]|uniref:Uncharacterized protein n=1 Tax=Berkelbacteria bacterium GW2011_GWE1_39_12 TaxID=1618337 RepID=A0A0G4B333_9BACT|nr:MAG: hypothetical protein UT28_C0001G0179 [Berkelbacteria bacterium GW2011_GWE1_39_12]HBO60617.1 hypothetical protein [Candidatus Berkelbacteria bacterium]